MTEPLKPRIDFTGTLGRSLMEPTLQAAQTFSSDAAEQAELCPGAA